MILGIDIGTSSIGWALLATDSDVSPNRIVDAGVRIFPAGVDGDIDSGREKPQNLKRRDARSARRLGWSWCSLRFPEESSPWTMTYVSTM